ncbi:hypothetical protein EUCA11A_43620 [Eubacterium callanderi]|uniref:DUF951 domain-containing protein n=1 Tax=Eubacterium callanderi TaxID=53442 RepID=UPI0029FF485A|nr:DUF951 domain-containing protein [Eubacterium callanderi]WPK70165.1 hypothetical protein EUCA2A_43620 [Eubacterium callanderi]WPK74463.1 hypothetical protein EUCA11A_43620 [Eubacterium callanderi]
MENRDYGLGDIVELKKKHPCGSYNWKILRMGGEIKLKCTGCEHMITVPRSKFNKMIKKVVEHNENNK